MKRNEKLKNCKKEKLHFADAYITCQITHAAVLNKM